MVGTILSKVFRIKKYNWLYCKIHKIRIWKPTNIYDSARISDGVSIGAFSEVGKDVEIGENTRIGSGVFIPEKVKIGRDCFIGPRTVFSNDRFPPSPRDNWEDTIIEDNVSIGANVSIRPGITVKRYSLLGMGTVVVHNIPENEIWVGNPSRKLRQKRGK